MKITTIMGSPRKDGNTSKVLEWVEEELRGKSHDVERINITDKKVNPCLCCDKCQEYPDRAVCSQDDDAVSIFESFVESDAIIFASPLYCWGFTAQLKALIDRCGCVINDPGGPEFSSILEGRKTALLVTCAGPEGDNADLIQEAFRRLSRLYKCDVSNILVIPFTTEPDNLPEDTKQKASDLASSFWG